MAAMCSINVNFGGDCNVRGIRLQKLEKAHNMERRNEKLNNVY